MAETEEMKLFDMESDSDAQLKSFAQNLQTYKLQTLSQNIILRITRLESVADIQNIIGRYLHLTIAGKHEECVELFALKTPDVCVKTMSGTSYGTAEVRELHLRSRALIDGEEDISACRYAPSALIVEMTEDGKAARARWMASCPAKLKAPSAANSEEVRAWLKFDADLILEDGKWKIWHLSIDSAFSTAIAGSTLDNRDTPNGENHFKSETIGAVL